MQEQESMGGFRLAILDIKSIWTTRTVRKSLLVLMVLPLMFSFIYLWRFGTRRRMWSGCAWRS